jgi:hypothetical protein
MIASDFKNKIILLKFADVTKNKQLVITESECRELAVKMN